MTTLEMALADQLATSRPGRTLGLRGPAVATVTHASRTGRPQRTELRHGGETRLPAA
ncbi:MAG TPA: hypothetical protein VE196_00915 [Pseudonocardiaceae bacterium]|nr:hypothetical protein [Pseudonocardiaceae bacterium]